MIVLLTGLAVQAATPINVAGKDCKCDKDYTYTASDITDLKSGTVTYTYSTNTLTLTNVTITRTGGSNYAIHNRSNQGLIVKFVGTCNLTTEGRVIRDQSGGENQLVANSGATVNLKSTGNGTIYVRDFTTLWIKGPGTFNITGPKDGAIAGHGSWNASGSDLPTYDYVKFSNVTATVTGAQSALLGLDAYFYAGSNVTLKATGNSSYPVAREITGWINNNTAILAPWGAAYSSSDQSIVLNGSKIYNQDIYISDNYALLLNSTNFPDANFRNYMLSLYPKGYLTQSELNNLTSLNVANKGISNMKGIEKLTALKELRCWGNSFTSLDLNSNTSLTYLDCAPNTSLTSLSINNCTNLETLICYSTGITSLSLSNLSKLKTLDCYNTKLTSLTASGKGYLTSLNCKNCTSLTYLDVNNDALTSLNVTGNTALNYLYCYGNSSLTAITGLADCTAITTLNCSSCKLTDLSACNSMTNLATLDCQSNRLTSLELTFKSKLTYVSASYNTSLTTANIYSNSALTKLFVNGCTALTTLRCSDNNLTTLNISGNTALQTLKCYYNDNLSTITGLANCTAITYLDAERCALTDLSACNSMTNLATLYCNRNKLTSLTLTNKSKLTFLSAYNNTLLTTANINNNSALTTLDVRNCPALTTLSCYSNKLSSLDLSGNTALTQLICWNNQLTSLDVSALTNLTRLECYSNQLTALNVNNNTKLQRLDCCSNKLTSLNVSGITSLTYLGCYSNQLTSLNVQGCSALFNLQCQNNKLTSLYVQGCTALKHLYCHKNQISAAGMTTLVNSLPTCTSSSPGTLYALYNTSESNVFNASHLAIAQAKYWYPKKYNGSSWVDITFGIRGDVNGDNQVNIADVADLIDMLLNGATPPSTADVDGDGQVNIADVAELIDLLLGS